MHWTYVYKTKQCTFRRTVLFQQRTDMNGVHWF